MKFVKGETVEQFGSKYIVENVYQLSDEYMKEHDLYYRNRITLVKIEGVNGLDRMDFAITE